MQDEQHVGRQRAGGHTRGAARGAARPGKAVPLGEPSPCGESLLGLCCRWDEQAECVVIDVWNSAHPLLEEELRLAFEWGARGRAAASDVGGSGYGLNIVYRLVDLMGGTVVLLNAPLPDWLRTVLKPNVAEEEERPEGVRACICLPRKIPA